jgi:translation initiation factor 2B subunit (eIF-2B alpha/beta/delta family)
MKAEKELEQFLNDKIHGSSEILDLILKHYSKYANNKIYLIKASQKIYNELSHFPVVTNFIKEVKNILQKKNAADLIAFLKNYKHTNDEKLNRLFQNTISILDKYKTILTISHSKTLVNIFNLWRRKCKDIKIFVCESRPAEEGLIMAEELKKQDINVTLITEAMAGNLMKEIDVIVLGADQILSNGNIVNKTGSRILAILARYHKIPLYVVSTSDKIVKSKKYKAQVEKNFIQVNHRKIKKLNQNFEIVEKNLITKIITD